MQPTSRTTRRGFTVVEVLVASMLMLILITLIGQFLVPSLRYQSRGLVQSDLMRQGYRAMDGLVRDLRMCPASLLTYDPAAAQICGRVRSDWTPDGTCIYSAECWVYWWDAAEQRLGRTVIAPGGAQADLTQPVRVPLPELKLAVAGARWKYLCSGLVRFEFKHDGVVPEAPSGRYTVHLSLRRDSEKLDIQQIVTPRLSR